MINSGGDRPASLSVTHAHRARIADAAAAMIVRVHRNQHGSEADSTLLKQAVSHLWQANDAGDLCLSLNELAEQIGTDSPIERLHEQLLASPAISQGAAMVSPLVLDDYRLYRYAHWQAETTIASQLAVLSERQAFWQADASVVPAGLSNEQQRGWQIIASQSLLLLSGGPGTGKTHMLGTVIDGLRRQQPAMRVALTAPTGKAAARLNQSLMQSMNRAADQPSQIVPSVASTLHRLLGLRADGSFEYGDDNPLPFDLVVVDECSMVDAMLAAQLLAAIGPHARLVLAGDKDQLASVQAGAFFGDCMAGHRWLASQSVVLTHNFRQAEAQDIVAMADAVRAGVTPLPQPHASVTMIETDPAAAVAQAVNQACQLFEPLVQAAMTVGDDAAVSALLSRFDRIRVLCTLRAGPMGVNRLNETIAARLRIADAPAADAGELGHGPWFAGRLVIVTRNLPSLSLFNGDIGLTVSDRSGGLVVAFESADGLRRLMPLELPPCDDAFALTVHQSQGSDFDHVLLLPAPAGHALATRAGLYTAMTRARKLLTLFARADDLNWAAQHAERRAGGLSDRLSRLNTNQTSD